MESSSEQPGRSRALSALAALWLLLTLGIVLPSATVVYAAPDAAGAGQVAVDRLQTAVAIDGTDVVVADGDRLDDGPDGQPAISAGLAVLAFSGQSEGKSALQSSTLGRDRASPFEARAPPLG